MPTCLLHKVIEDSRKQQVMFVYCVRIEMAFVL